MSVRNITDFENWLTDCGAEVLDPTSEWEILRVKTNLGFFVVHENRKGIQIWPDGLLQIAKSYQTGIPLALAATRRQRKRCRTMRYYGSLIKRDGCGCFYCGQPLSPPGAPVPPRYDTTTEHLVSVAHGGPDHLSNKFLAHRKCNEEAGTLSAPEKIALRERRREMVNAS